MRLLDDLPTPVLITNNSGVIISANSAATAVFGLNAEQIGAISLIDIMLPHSKIVVATHIDPIVEAGGTAKEVYLELDSRDGKVPVLVDCKQVTDEGIDGVVWVMMVTFERSKFESDMLVARKRAETINLELLKSGRFLKSVTDAVPGLIAYMDRNFYCVFANKTCEEWYERPAGSLIGLHLREFMPAAIYATSEPYLHAVLAGTPQHFQRAMLKPDGTMRHTLLDYIPDLGEGGHVVGCFVMATDVTALKLVESELKLAQRIFENTVEGIMVTDELGTILSVNPAFTTITGFSSEEAIGETPRILKSGRYERDISTGLWAEIQTNGRWEGETWNCHKDGTAFLARQTITTIDNSDGYPLRYLTVFYDITERWQRDEQMRHLAFHDPLTDLPNRSLLMERLAQLITATGRQEGMVAILFLDLDGFKSVNDTYGHETGDAVLQIVGQKLQHIKRMADTVGRLGGDEFILLVNDPASHEEVAHIAERIIHVVGEPMHFRGNTMHLGVSIGIAVYPVDAQAPSQLVKHADIAMYHAKTAGKNRYCFYEHNLAVADLVIQRK